MTAMRQPDPKPPVIAIVDDDHEVRVTLCALLGESGFEPVPCDGSAAFFALGDPPPVNLAIIDLRLRGESGLNLAVQIGARYDIPIVMLTGIGDESDKIMGLENGADDYLMKPFNPRELVARIRSVLRRYGHGTHHATTQPEHTITFGNKRIDTQARVLLNSDGHEIPLTNGEYRLLEYLARNPSRVISRPELLSELGSDMERYVDRTIDVLILRLRRKIEDTPSKPRHLQTRRSQGYFFELNAD
ncbi:two-component system, OmpR family, response regulator/two-component system, OmpR family, phosphate regulon response regulator OmpR [Loktanella sp. DSM 29012]|uniref:winged helix-turn-helix domain-containing protein n=1 Tax=Loktanella sp. DSM 29012 TaxID=1881056 RepID=UPI0008B951FB|nr:two-component system, OmpR family, response regulator/two-component system, OmpR family, phosphate regulon response regulator OmpR [Loktanella sp. DSM 29012]